MPEEMSTMLRNQAKDVCLKWCAEQRQLKKEPGSPQPAAGPGGTKWEVLSPQPTESAGSQASPPPAAAVPAMPAQVPVVDATLEPGVEAEMVNCLKAKAEEDPYQLPAVRRRMVKKGNPYVIEAKPAADVSPEALVQALREAFAAQPFQEAEAEEEDY